MSQTERPLCTACRKPIEKDESLAVAMEAIVHEKCWDESMHGRILILYCSDPWSLTMEVVRGDGQDGE